MFIGAHKVTWDEHMKTIAVYATKNQLDEFEQLIKRLDVPPPPVRNIEVTIYLMSALGQPAATPVPPELEGVVKQLRSMFSYKGYQLIDTQVIRVRAGQGGNASAVIDSGSTQEMKTVTQLKFRAASASSDEKGRAIRIDGLTVALKVPVATKFGDQKQYSYLDTGFSTDVDLHEGQKVVVGKANMDGSDKASIVVLSAKVVD